MSSTFLLPTSPSYVFSLNNNITEQPIILPTLIKPNLWLDHSVSYGAGTYTILILI